jgi:hypothetical protein
MPFCIHSFRRSKIEECGNQFQSETTARVLRLLAHFGKDESIDCGNENVYRLSAVWTMNALRRCKNYTWDRMIAKGAKPGDLIFPNTIGGVEGHFLRKLQAIAERAGVAEPELHRFRKSYTDTLADEGLPVLTIMSDWVHCSLDVTLAYLRGREAKGEQEQNLANQSALATYV